MYKKDARLVFSPSDLTLFMDSPFASWMERFANEFPDDTPEMDSDDAMLVLLQGKGDQHEHDVLADFQAQGLNVVDAGNADDSVDATREAIRTGADVIFQAVLEQSPFKGFADFLIKVPGQSELGDYHYEVWDTKLSKTIKPYFVVQLCCYTEMLATIQGRRAEQIVVVLGNKEPVRLRTNDYFYYYLSLKNSFLTLHHEFTPECRPDPADSSSWGRWESYASQLLIDIDHLSQVATMSRSQIKKLEQAGLSTMQQLVDSDLDSVSGIKPNVFQRLRRQAAIQKASLGKDKPEFKIIHPDGDKQEGLALLPPGSAMDVFFDIEGYPLDDGGLEYLWGNSYFDQQGKRQFKDFWAHNPQQEKQCFEEFIAWVYQRWQADPSMHIYHYANYEIAACRKLMGRYGVCETEVDQLLRNEVFIDLYKVVKGGLLLGEPRYSIKNVEHLYRGKRQTEVGTGGDSVVVYEQWRELNSAGLEGDTWQTSKILNDIRDYNIDDCDSTQELVDWLRIQQAEAGITYSGHTEVIEPEVPEEVTARTELRDQLLTRAEQQRLTNEAQSRLTENLAWSLEFHRREAKPVFWKLFDRLGMSDEELVDDLDCLAHCQRTDREPFKKTPRTRNLAYEYSFDRDQEFKGAKQSFYVVGEEDEDGRKQKVAFVAEESNVDQGLITLQSKEPPKHILSLVPDEYVNPKPIPEAIDQQVSDYAANRLGQCAIVDFLNRDTPRIKGHKAGAPIAVSDHSTVRRQQIIQAISSLDNSYLPIQGPPGAGKSYTGKHVIAELMQQGKRVGICSNSHKAINNLLLSTATYCNEQGIQANFACAKNTEPELAEQGVAILANNKQAEFLQDACVVGTTAWGFSRPDMAGQLDYLFIDEAGQVSVANLIAISRSAKNLVLMGDQMQLGQPTQGTHPAESGLSILDYLLHDSPTIPDHMGVFLDTTYRMHSAVNRFISAAIYQGKLTANPANDTQVVQVPTGYQGLLDKDAGIIFSPVQHEGNTQASDEEVEQIARLVNQLLGRTFTSVDGIDRPISWADILFVAPYNHQVNKLKQRLGDRARVGSVDKFQGQEAPIVILSMCASDPSESPRGLDFLLDKNRLNVAVSRAQSLAIVVASPSLLNAHASNVKQMEKVNLFCQLVECGT